MRARPQFSVSSRLVGASLRGPAISQDSSQEKISRTYSGNRPSRPAVARLTVGGGARPEEPS